MTVRFEAGVGRSAGRAARGPGAGVSRWALGMVLAGTLAAGGGCRQDMQNQPKYLPFARNVFFADQRASRPLVTGVVARGHLDEDQGFFTGMSGGALLPANPLGATREVMLRGQERYNIYCSPCHDRVGGGDGMIVQRGFKQPPTFHSDRLRSVPDGYFFQVITNGFGTMPSYAPQVPARDRWMIVAYVRALQYSQHATLADVPEADRAQLGGGQ